MRRFRGVARSTATQDTASTPSVRYVYDRPLPYARVLRIEIVGPNGVVLSATTKSFQPGRGWVTEPGANCA